MIQKVKISRFTKFSYYYKNELDVIKLDKEEFQRVVNSYKGIKAKFAIRDWYGSVDNRTFKVTDVELDERGSFATITISAREVPERFFPTLFEICKQNNILGPISCMILT